MTQIPVQLKSCRFIKTIDKSPIEKEWTTINNYDYNSFNYNGTTYGVATGFNKLVVVDCDSEFIQNKLLEIENFRNTFTVKTATKKLYHFYFIVDIDNPKSFSLDDKNDMRIVDLQAVGKMVVGPNSVLSTNNQYEIVNGSEIANISYDYLKNVLMNIDDSIKIFSKPDKSDAKQVYIEFDDICSQIKNKLTIKDILTRNGIDVGTGGNCMCPLGHTSVGGKCFSYTRNVWYCFHCHKTGNIFHLHMEINHTTFQNAKIALADMSGISDQINNEIVLKFQNKKKAAASELLARQFIKLYRVRAVRQDTSDEIYIYKEGIYVPEGKSYIREYVRSVLGLLYTETFANDVIDKIIVDSYIDKNRFFINERINLLPVANGILDLDTLELLDFSPQYIFFSKLPVIYDPLIKPEKTLQFIRDITKDDTDMITLQEIGGYLLYRESKFEKAFMFSGDGRNGKSKMLELYTNIIGEENVTAISLSSIELDSFSMSNLYGKYANFSADISEEALEGTGNFKQLVGRDNIDANRKFKSHITFTNFAKMIFSANKIPSTKDLSEGFFGRWIMVHFPYKFEDNPTEPHHKKRDIEIIEKISTPIELTGLLNWFIEGLKRILKNQKFTDNTSFNDIKTDWICASNTFAKFWLSEIEVTNNPSDIIKRDDMMEYYDDYCIKNKLEKADNKLIYQFSNQSCVYKRAGSGADKYMVYKKVKFKNPNLPPIDINNVPYIHDTGIKKEDEIVEKF